MIELVQLERRHDDFARRQSRVIVVSVEGQDMSKKTQSDFPHLLVLSDESRGLSEMAGLIHPGAAPMAAMLMCRRPFSWTGRAWCAGSIVHPR